MFSSLANAFIIFAAAGAVAAHGIVGQVIIDGRTFLGSNGVTTSRDSPIRRISTGSPVKNEYGNEIICGPNARAASGVATASPGSRFQFFWKMEDGGNWPHNTGPVITYMARCDGDCTTFQPDANTRWFKIAQAGLKQPNVPDTWYQKDTMNGVPIEVVLPQNLAPGGYIVRHETVSLHLAGSVGGAEFYPSCLQLRVTGNGNGVPDQTVRFPGAYNENDPGLVGNFFAYNMNYRFPGGPIAKLTGESGNDGGDNSAPSPSPSPSPAPTSSRGSDSSKPTSTPPPPSANSTGNGNGGRRCRVRKNKRDALADPAEAGTNAKRAFAWHRSRRSFALVRN